MSIGVDYASVDGNASPDCAAAYRAGVRFAYVRGAHGATRDATPLRDLDRWRAAGVAVGVYGIIEWRGAPIRDQAAALMLTIGTLAPGDLPPSVDVEFGGSLAQMGISAEEVVGRVEEYAQHLLAAYGCAAVYTSQNQWVDNCGDRDSPLLAGLPLWVKTPYSYRAGNPPHLDDERIGKLGLLPRPWRAPGSAGAWIQQFQGDAKGLPGFTATVDLNSFRPFGGSGADARAPWVTERLRAHGFAALADFQRACGLDTDGVVGPRTLARLARRP